MKLALLITAVLNAQAAASGPPESADEIMARVAINQDLAETARTAYVYHQKIAIRLRDSHNKLVREEISQYDAIPGATRTRKQLVDFKGRYWKDGSMASYQESGQGRDAGFRSEADAGLAHDLRDDLTGSGKSKDGLAPNLFPLTARQQRRYQFALKGTERYQGTEVYRIAFEPKKSPGNHDETIWKGEALISKAEYQPLLITTRMARGIPLFVRTALGTNIQGLGFSVQYRRFDDGVWFPVSYGTEFRVHAVFIYSRQITVSMVNTDFRKADVNSSVEFAPVP